MTYFKDGIEKTSGVLNAESEQRLEELLGERADQLLKHYGSPPPEIEATITDMHGNVYKGTLYLVEDNQDNA